ncbi:MAG: hypothetical protein Fur0041_01720 [Bacteroidia bacterium]
MMLYAQAVIGTPEWVQQHQGNQSMQRNNSNVQPLNGNDTLHTSYSNTACGLNYTMVSQRLGQRFTPIGIQQPAPFVVNNLPPCAVVDKAFLYTEALGVTPSITATITNPASTTTNVPMTLIGSSVDVCWGMNGTHVWRADVTNLITGPGTYMLSGLPTSLQSTTGVDVEGATLIIIYEDPSATYTGSIQIDDGCHTVVGGTLIHNMNGLNVCANSSNAKAFMLVGDMQMSGYNIMMNSTNVPQPAWNWWNEISTPTSVTSGQTTSMYAMNVGGDCYTLAMAGLYYQTNCQTCVPSSNNLVLTTTSTPSSCSANGSAAVNVTGGSGNYSYLWMPGGQTSPSVNNLSAGTYTVYVTDGPVCSSATVTVAYTGMTLAMSAQPTTCNTLGSASVTVTGGTGPYTYQWAPSGGTGATATNLNPGIYVVSVTDATGCTMTNTVTVQNGSTMNVSVTALPDSCPSPSGAVYATVTGGVAPYTYQWLPGNQTTSSVTGLPAGTYSVIVTDAAGCMQTASGTITTAPNNVQVVTNQYMYALCGDTVQLSATCNYPNATYSWSPSTWLNNPNIQNPVATPAGNITYTVTATHQCGTATDSVFVELDTLNYYSEQICFVTIDTSINKNIVIWERLNSPQSGTYNIYRETSVSGVYALIGSQPVSQFTTYVDMTSNPQQMANRYVITTVDPCGNESDTSFHHRTIHLQTSPNGNGGWNLSWTAYEGLPIATYNIYRGASISQLTLLNQVAGNVFTYTDLTPPPGNLYYLIEAVHPFGGCMPSLRLSSGNNTFSPVSSSISNLEPTDAVGVNETELLSNSLMILPNPNNGTFSIEFNSNSGNVTIEVMDQLGRIVFAKQDAVSGIYRTQIAAESLSASVYTLRVTTGEGSVMKPLMISR